jgi:Lactonase, 7-bladed beta-propeller/haloacid dehalogenase-like hydrolase
VPWAIATSGRPVSARPTLEALGVPTGVPIVTRDRVGHAKPDPDQFPAAAHRLGVPIGDAAVVGDSVWDLLAARRARAQGIGLLSGGYCHDELERAGAYRVYQDPADLLRHLDEEAPADSRWLRRIVPGFPADWPVPPADHSTTLARARRGHDSVAMFTVAATSETLMPLGQEATEPTPRSFEIDSTGKFLYAAGESSGKVACYRIDEKTGKLKRFTTLPVGKTPWWLLAVAMPAK